MEFSWIVQNIGDAKKNRALKEIEIKKNLIETEGKFTEKDIERRYYATEEGQYLALNSEYAKVIGKMISFIRFRLDALRGKI